MWTGGRGLLRPGVAGLRISLSGCAISGESPAGCKVLLGNASVRGFSLVNGWRNRPVRRTKLWKVLIPSLTATAWSAVAAKMSASEAVKKCDELYEAGNMAEGHAAIMAVKDDPNPEVQWRIARMQFKVAERSGKPEEVTRAIQEGLERLRANLEKTPKCPNTHKWIAILLGSKDKHPSFKEQIEDAFLIREHLHKAIEYNPTDGYAHYILGKWCYQVASVSWYQKKIAATLFASPPESSYEIALQHFKDAEKLKPDIFSTCHLMAAQCLLQMGKKDEAGEYLKKCIAQENRNSDSKKTATEAVKIAKKNSIQV